MNTQLTNEILNVFQRYRMEPTALDQYESVGKGILGGKIDKFIVNNKPIDFIMLGYPMKSANDRDKVIGKLPDMAEEVSMANFRRFKDEIVKIYPIGLNINVASDGYAFNDLLGVSDKTVEEYQLRTEDMSAGVINILNLKDFYGSIDRDRLIDNFGISDDELEHRILFDSDVNYLYRGMIRFMTEELAIKNFPSGNQLQKAAKKLTRQMMLRNEAYSGLIKHEFPDHIRLSMHPSTNSGQKYSFQLIPSARAKHSPWHCVLIKDGQGIGTMHKKEAIEAGYEVQYKDGQPYFFERQ